MQCPACSTPIPAGDRQCPTCGADPVTSAPTLPPEAIFAAPSLDLPPGTSFAGRYTLIEKAGEGGMGVVYKAIDNALNLVVALKLIRPDLARHPAFVERFKQEVRLTRQVSHANVCRVHDLGEVDGILFLSMEWIDGETLRRLLNQAALLEPRRALEIACKIFQALAAAHARGIIHRDLKPENVMVDPRGEVFVMDFGVALGPGEGQTPGVHPGTPPYMSPEQMRGEPLDHRTDLYALGLILQEMLIGRIGTPGRRGPLALPYHLRRSVGPVLQSLLAEQPEKRYTSAEKMAEALREIEKGSSRSSRRSRMRELLIRHRGRVLLASGASGAAGVILAVTTFYFATRPPKPNPVSQPGLSPPAAVFYQRGLDYLRKDGDTQRILNQAIQMLNRAVEKDPGSAIAWATLSEACWTRYEQRSQESAPTPLTFREEAVRAMGNAIRLGPDLPEVHNAKGRGLIAEGDFAAAVPELKRAVEEKPDFDTAWANLGIAYRELKDGYRPGLEALRRAIRLDPRSFRHQVYLGLFHYRFGEYEPSEKAYRKALELRPDSKTAWENLATVFLQMNRLDEAISALLESLKIEETPWTQSNLGTAYYFRGDYRQAAVHYRRAAEIEPRNAVYWGNLGDALKMLQQDSQARDAYLKAVENARKKLADSPQDPGTHMNLGLFCARVGEEACALEEGSRAESMQPENLEILFKNAVIFSILGRIDNALDKLEMAAKLGLTRVVIENDPDLARLRNHPRYYRILDLAN